MSLLELGGKRFTIPAGEVFLGSDAGCAIQLSGAGVLPRHAVVQGLADGQVVIRKAAPEAEVMINGVRLGPSRHRCCTETKCRSAVTSSPSWMSAAAAAPSTSPR